MGEPKSKLCVCMWGVLWMVGSWRDVIQTGADVWVEEQGLAETTPTCVALVTSGCRGHA